DCGVERSRSRMARTPQDGGCLGRILRAGLQERGVPLERSSSVPIRVPGMGSQYPSVGLEPALRRPQADRIYLLEWRAIWRYLQTQPACFWLLNIYMFFEYVRPQSVWPSLAILPWSSGAL